MDKLLLLIVGGFASGLIYSMVAAGLTLTYATTGVLNLSYGAIAYSSAYTFYQLRAGQHWGIVPAALFIVVVLAPLLAALLDVVVFRKLARTNDFVKLIVTVGLLMAIPALVRLVFDTLQGPAHAHFIRSVDVSQILLPRGLGPAPKKVWHLIGTSATFDSNQLVVLIVATVSASALWFLVRWTRLGLQLRAVVDRPNLAGTRGVSLTITSLTASIVGTVLAALAGIAAAPILAAIDEQAFVGLVFIGVAAAVLGGLRSIPLAFAGGLFLGLVQNLAVGYLSFAHDIHGFYEAMPFVVLLLVLLVVGKNKARVAGSSAEGSPPAEYLSKMPRWRRRAPWSIAAAGLLLYLFVLGSHYWQNLLATGLAVALIFLSFAVVLGLGGMISLAQAAFVSIGGMTAGLLVTHYHWPFIPALIGAVVVAIVVGMLVALPALRLGGLYLTLATLALGLLADNLLLQWPWFSNKSLGWTLAPPRIGPIKFATYGDARPMAALLLLLVAGTALMVRNLQRSSSGRRIDAVRSSEAAAATSGISLLKSKLVIFAVSAAIAAVGGVFYASLQGTASGSTAPTSSGLLWLAAVVFFGVRRPGPLIMAGISVVLFPAVLANGVHIHWWKPLLWFGWNGTPSLEIPAILFGLGAIGLANHPDGVASQFGGFGYARWAKRADGKGRTHSESALETIAGEELAEIETQIEDHRQLLEQHAATTPTHDTQSIQHRAETAAVALRSLRAGYGDVEVLHGIDLAINPGEIVGLFGANGSGKSTLAGAIAGLVKTADGTIAFQGRDITSQTTHHRARSGLVVAPESRGIFPGLTVAENLTLVLPARDDRKKAFDRFPILQQRRHVLAGNLSGGEQQMLTLAPFLARPPEVLIADEPTLGLAPLIVVEIVDVFAELRDRGVAVLLIEERASAVLQVADWVAILELGHVVWQGPRVEVDGGFLASAYLGSTPQTKEPVVPLSGIAVSLASQVPQ